MRAVQSAVKAFARLAALLEGPAAEAQALLDELYAQGEPDPDSGLAQAGLRDGAGLYTVSDYLAHGEAGIAFEHLIYMVTAPEPQLVLSSEAQADMAMAARLLGIGEDFLHRHQGGGPGVA